MNNMVDINLNLIGSFAFLVLETTDLPYRSKPVITEFSMIACSPKDLRELEDDIDVPRISYKLTMYFNPHTRIHPEAEEKSGLINEMLTNQNQFNQNAANVIINFIEHLPKPVCLVAHNGNRFQYPILKAHLQELGVNLPDDLLCTDSLNVFRDLDIFDNSCNSQNPFPNLPTKLGKRSFVSFKLGDIYERRVFKKAKYDNQDEIEPSKIVKILKIASSYLKPFEEHVIKHAKLFSEIK